MLGTKNARIFGILIMTGKEQRENFCDVLAITDLKRPSHKMDRLGNKVIDHDNSCNQNLNYIEPQSQL